MTSPSPRRGSPWAAIVCGGAVGVLITALVLGSAGGGGVEVRDAAVGATTSPAAAVYLTLANSSGTADALIGARCNCSAEATLHVSSIDDAGVASMAGVQRLELAAGDTVAMAPGGSHVMLEELAGPLRQGDRVELELRFASGAARTVQVPVMSLADLAERRDATDQEGR